MTKYDAIKMIPMYRKEVEKLREELAQRERVIDHLLEGSEALNFKQYKLT